LTQELESLHMLSTRISLAKKIFHRIHTIELKDIYSESEIDPLLRELERINHEEWKDLRFKIDLYYRDKDDYVLRKVAISRLRAIFHKVLKENNCDPLK